MEKCWCCNTSKEVKVMTYNGTINKFICFKCRKDLKDLSKRLEEVRSVYAQERY